MSRFDKEKLVAEIEEEERARELEEKNKEELPARISKMVIDLLEELANEMGWNENREIIGPEHLNPGVAGCDGWMVRWELKFTVAGKTYSLPVTDATRIATRHQPQVEGQDRFSDGLIEEVSQKAKQIMVEIRNNNL
ncbi:hypothetical protein KKI22_01520 [Patescibacteria group bacterium]|nr:hypothetical protein [Patescibacteria group bacterium]